MNHQQEAEKFISSPIGKDSSYVDRRIAIAQVHATLALAAAQNRTADELAGIREQQRVANLIELDSTEAFWTLHYNENEGIEGKGVSAKLRPDIASALGIGATK